VATNIANVNTVAGISADVTTVAADGTDIGTVAGIAANVTTVAGVAANVTTVAGIAANVTTVAGIDSDVTAVAADATDIGAVASNIASVNTVAGISADITTVAGIDTEVTAVAGIDTEITALYADLANINVKVGKTSDTGSAIMPAGTEAQRDGSPSAGYLRFNSDTSSFEGYDGSAWGSIGGGGTPGGSDTQIQYNNAGAFAGASGLVTDGSNLTINAQGDLRFADSDSSNWVAFQAPATVASNVTWTLPDADGTDGQVIKTNGTGTLSWITPSAGGGGGGTSVTVTQITATAAQTDFSVTYTVGQLSVYLNGALLASADYTASNGTTVVLAAGAASGDIFTALAYDSATQITEGDSSVVVTDSGTGKVEVTVDNVEVADFTTGAIVFNETGANQDFRVEGDTDANLLVVDASADKIGIKTNTPAVELDVVGQVRASTGILFGTDTLAGNALDDYEQGSWTPSVGGNATYGAQDGRYTKIGNMVYFSGHLIVTTLGTGSVTTVSGLPFTAVSGAGVTGAATISYFTTLAVNVITPVLEVNQGATNMSVYSRVTAGTVAAQVSIFGDGARIYFTGMYRH
jgi:hypothetical protein